MTTTPLQAVPTPTTPRRQWRRYRRGDSPGEMAGALAPVATAILGSARSRARQQVRAARGEADRIVAAAHAEAARLLAAASADAAAAADEAASALGMAARREAREALLAARRQIYEGVRARVLDALLDDPAAAAASSRAAQIAAAVQVRLGPGAIVVEEDRGRYTVRSASGEQRATVGLEMLVDAAMGTLSAEVERLWG